MAQLNITLDTELLHGLFTKDSKDEAFSKLLEAILNQVLLAQSAEQLGAEPYERNDDRTAYRNGFRDRDLTTRIGAITFKKCHAIETVISAPPCFSVTNAANKRLFLR